MHSQSLRETQQLYLDLTEIYNMSDLPYPEEVKDEVEPRVVKVDGKTGEVLSKE